MADDHSALVGKWIPFKNEMFEEFLAANGANWMARKMAGKSKAPVDITIEGDEVKVVVVTMVFTREESFTIGTPFEQKQVDGTVSLAVAKWEDGKLVIEYKPKVEGQGKAQTVTREVKDGQLIMTCEVDDVVCRRWFDKAT